MRRKIGWASGGAVAVVLFIACGWHFDWSKSDWASWVQAVGSIGAIVAAGEIAASQTRKARDWEVRRSTEQMRALCEVVGTLARLLALEVESKSIFLSSQMDARARDSFLSGKPFADIATAARAIPLHAQPEIPEVRLVFSLQKLASTAIEVYESVAVELGTSMIGFLVAREPFAAVISGCHYLEAQCSKRATELATRH
jgi:hypothetical protein